MKARAFCAISCLLTWCFTVDGREALPDWKTGTKFEITAEVFTQELDLVGGKLDWRSKVEKMQIFVVILDAEKRKGAVCRKIDFIAPEEKSTKKPSPNRLRSEAADSESAVRYRLMLDIGDGWPRKVICFNQFAEPVVVTVGNVRIVPWAPGGIPLDMLPLVEPVSESSANGSVTVAMGGTTAERILTYRSKEGSEMVIHQIWIKGERWWREFERYRDGKLELRAKLVPPTPPEPPLTLPVAPPIVAGDSKATVVDETDNPLLQDRRLRKTVTIKLVNARVQDLLAPCNTVLDLSLVADANVDSINPVFMSVNWVDVPVWSVMTRLAEAPTIKGHWEKTPEGYRLHSSLAKPTDLAKDGSNRVLLTTLSIVAILLVASVLVVQRWRKKKTA
jgi:hypothetical protein